MENSPNDSLDNSPNDSLENSPNESLDNSPNDSSTKALTMIIKDIKSLLAKQSVEFIQAEGNPFNPLLHDADDFTENSDFDDNVVVQEIQRGYKIHGNVVRPSKVIVNKNTVSSSVDINE